jgi:hypothetical protein
MVAMMGFVYQVRKVGVVVPPMLKLPTPSLLPDIPRSMNLYFVVVNFQFESWLLHIDWPGY